MFAGSLSIALGIAALAPATIDLEWDAPRECPDRAAVRTEIDELAIGDSRHVTAIAVVTQRHDELWHLELEIDTADGRQHFEWDARSCGSLARGAALAIVAAADTAAIAVPAPPAPQPPAHDAVAEPTPAPAPTVVDAPAPDRAPSSRAADASAWAEVSAGGGCVPKRSHR